MTDACECGEHEHGTCYADILGDSSDDPYNQHAYNQQQTVYGQDHYGQTYPPRTPLSPNTARVVSPQLRSPNGYDTFIRQPQDVYGMAYTHQSPPAAASPPLRSPSAHSWGQAGQTQDAYGGYDNGATSMPQPLPAPTPQRMTFVDPQDNFARDDGYNNQPGGSSAVAEQYGGYGDQAHPAGDEDLSGPSPPSYDSAAGAGFMDAHNQGSSTGVRQQAWHTAADEKSRQL